MMRRTLVLLLVLLGGAWAQDLVFTSERLGTSDVFVRRDGVTFPLVFSDDLAEFDPSPSPDGSLVAYAATSFVVGVTSFEDDWTWEYRAVDLEGRERGRWSLPGGDNNFRPAGGFELAWLPDGRSFLAQGYTEDADWEVRRFFLDTERTVYLGSGFGILLSPDGSAFAITRNDQVFVISIADGLTLPLGRGRALGWTPDGAALLVERNFGLLLVPIEDVAAAEVIGDSGPYLELRWSPDGRHYAYTILIGADSAIFFHDGAHNFLGSFDLGGLAAGFDWLDGEQVALELVLDEERRIITVDVEGTLTTLVDGTGGDGGPRRIP